MRIMSNMRLSTKVSDSSNRFLPFFERLIAAALLFASPAAIAEIRGAALIQHPHPGILSWGTELKFWPLSGGSPVVLKQTNDFGPGGCVADVDGDGRDDLIVQERVGSGPLVWLRAPKWEPHIVERETEFRDCLPFEFGGHKGVLVPHFNAQLRLYEYPKRADDKWAYSEIYSIYTASRQGGLVAFDVDGDGLTDLFIGNYWMRNPGKWDLPWRLFNMNSFSTSRIPRWLDRRSINGPGVRSRICCGPRARRASAVRVAGASRR